MSILDTLTTVIFDAHRRTLTGPAIEEVVFDLPDGVQTRVRHQLRIARVVITVEGRGRFEIVVLNEDDVGNESRLDSRAIPVTEHRRTWNKAALQTQWKEGQRERDSKSPAPECNLHRFDSIVVGKASEPQDLALFLAVCLLRWRLCPSLHEILYDETTAYIRRLIKSEHVDTSDVAEHVFLHLREPEGPQQVQRYVKKVIAGFAHQAKPQIPSRWVHDGQQRGMAVAAAAKYLEFSRQHIHDGIRQKRIQAKKVKGKWFVPEDELERLKQLSPILRP